MSPRNLLYSTAILLGSFLLFLLEPMAAKRLVPLLGGSAAVWTTCLVFFQVVLLLGYLCAHWLATRMRQGTQALVYTGLLAACLPQAALNLRPELHASVDHPIRSVFWLLSTLIGLPFLALSATNPLLQAWYARGLGGASSEGELAGPESQQPTPPYRLFALSNFGSLLALLVYPSLLEPRFSLRAQSSIWLAGFALFALACAGIALLSGKRSMSQSHAAPATAAGQKQPCLRDRVLWLLLAACGSLLLCAMTNHITQNIAAIPLLWIVPLLMYLLSFVVAFSRGQRLPRLLRVRIPTLGVSVARMALLGLTAVTLGSLVYMLDDTRMDLPLMVSLPFYCSALFIACLFCHAELHRLRPAPHQATSFYLLIAAGGALGSVFVGVMAPVIFSSNYELPCGLVLAAMLALAVTWSQGIGWRLFWSAAALGIAVVLFFAHASGGGEHTIARLRNFYGALRVTEDLAPPFKGVTRLLYHGTIRHGSQIFSDELRTTPTTYYAHDSGVGLALDLCCEQRPRRIGVIGLGTGTLAAYGRKGDIFRFYDINPLVERIARNLFSYVRESAAKIEVVPGDARLSLAGEPPQHYDVLVVDAFSGDAIPVHLLTSEALNVYRWHLQPDGIIAFHVSNSFLELSPVVLQQAEHAGLSAAFIRSRDDEEGTGEYSSDWVLVTSSKRFLSQPAVAEAATPITAKAGLRLWTDDYNSVLPLLKWKHEKEPEPDDTEKSEQPRKAKGSKEPAMPTLIEQPWDSTRPGS